VHAFLDGRDTPPRSADGYMRNFLDRIGGLSRVHVATVTGRYYAMDRDNRWERVERAYAAMVEGGEAAARVEGGEAAEVIAAPDPLAAIEQAYAGGLGDEFVAPTVIGGYQGMADGDGVFVANFRSDRVRQVLTALADPGFDGFARSRVPRLAVRLGMTAYSDALDAFYGALFPPLALENILGQVVADAGLTQLRIAETEKYAHVTFFFNGGREEVFGGEERILVPSPRVATYDLQPEMSAYEVTDKLVEAIDAARFDLIVVNYANGDMVGHTGVLAAAMAAAGTVDQCLGRLADAVTRAGGVLAITADHGNCETMRDTETGQPHTAHTLNPVPLVLVNAPDWVLGLRDGRLADVAPTVLRLLGLLQPAEMTGRCLIIDSGAGTRAAE